MKCPICGCDNRIFISVINDMIFEKEENGVATFYDDIQCRNCGSCFNRYARFKLEPINEEVYCRKEQHNDDFGEGDPAYMKKWED